MALLTTYSDANKVTLEPIYTRDQITGAYTDQYLQAYEVHQVTTAGRYQYIGMTLAAAQACQAAVDDPANGLFAKLFTMGGTMWGVEVQVSTVSIYQVSLGE